MLPVKYRKTKIKYIPFIIFSKVTIFFNQYKISIHDRAVVMHYKIGFLLIKNYFFSKETGTL